MLHVEPKVILEQLFLWEDLVLLDDLLTEKCEENPTLHKHYTVVPTCVYLEKRKFYFLLSEPQLWQFCSVGVVATTSKAPQIQKLHKW